MIFPCFRLALLLGIVSSVLSDYLFTLQEDNVYVQSTDRKGAWRFRIGTVANSSCPIATKLKVVPTEGSEGLEKLPGWDDEKDTNTTTEIGRHKSWFLKQAGVLEGQCLGDEQTGHGRRLTRCFRRLFARCRLCCRRQQDATQQLIQPDLEGGLEPVGGPQPPEGGLEPVGGPQPPEGGLEPERDPQPEGGPQPEGDPQPEGGPEIYVPAISLDCQASSFQIAIDPAEVEQVNVGSGDDTNAVVVPGTVTIVSGTNGLYPVVVSFSGFRRAFTRRLPSSLQSLANGAQIVVNFGNVQNVDRVVGFLGQITSVNVLEGTEQGRRQLTFSEKFPCSSGVALYVGQTIAGPGWDTFAFSTGILIGQVYVYPGGNGGDSDSQNLDSLAFHLLRALIPAIGLNALNCLVLPNNINQKHLQLKQIELYQQLTSQVAPGLLPPNQVSAHSVSTEVASSSTDVPVYRFGHSPTFTLPRDARPVQRVGTDMVFIRLTLNNCGLMSWWAPRGRLSRICWNMEVGVNNVFIIPTRRGLYDHFQALAANVVGLSPFLTIEEVNPSEVPIYMGFFTTSELPELQASIQDQTHSLINLQSNQDEFSIGQTFPFFCTGNPMTQDQANLYMEAYLLAFQALFGYLSQEQIEEDKLRSVNPIFVFKRKDDGDDGPGDNAGNGGSSSSQSGGDGRPASQSGSASGGNQPTCRSFRGGTETKQRAGTLTRFVATPTTDAFAVSEAGFFEEISAAELATLMYQGHSRQVSEVLGWRVRMHGPKVQLLQQLGDDEIAAFGEKPKRREKRVYKTKDEAASALQGMYRRKLARDRFKVLLLCNLEKYYDEESDRKSCSQPNDDREPFWLAPFRHLSLATILG
mmetsp:Transcript_3868/g.8525  ORF Transcript_3868/g.8525 Transcript_3868/m.8525 type:complete len:859 (-) Transcript_3868:4284-6860(-)